MGMFQLLRRSKHARRYARNKFAGCRRSPLRAARNEIAVSQRWHGWKDRGRRKISESQWTMLMEQSLDGDCAAYGALLSALTPALRRAIAPARTACGLDAEDVVQEVLLALHLKRNTWVRGTPVAPWVAAIARNKIVDAYRRRGRRPEVSIESVAETLCARRRMSSEDGSHDLERGLARLPARQRQVLQAVSLRGLFGAGGRVAAEHERSRRARHPASRAQVAGRTVSQGSFMKTETLIRALAADAARPVIPLRPLMSAALAAGAVASLALFAALLRPRADFPRRCRLRPLDQAAGRWPAWRPRPAGALDAVARPLPRRASLRWLALAPLLLRSAVVAELVTAASQHLGGRDCVGTQRRSTAWRAFRCCPWRRHSA